jgi:hypothetical protein
LITAAATDDHIGVEYAELWYRNSTDNLTWSAWTLYSTDPSFPWAWNFAFPNGDGYYEFYSITNDSLGNQEPAKVAADTICALDSTGPTSGLDLIATYWHSTSPIVINATASDNLIGVQNIELWYRNSSDNSTWSVWTLFAVDMALPWSWDFDFPDGDGYYEFFSIAIDNLSNPESGKSAAETICAYDTTPPTSSANAIASYWQSASPLSITATTLADLIGVQNVELWYRNSTDNSTWSAWTQFAVDSSSPWSFSFDFPAGDGYYEFFTLANDSLGNLETMKVLAETICGLDASPPTSWVDPISPYWQNGGSTTISAFATDDITGVESVTLWYRYSDDNSSWGSWISFGTDSSSPWSFSFNFPSNDGYYQFHSIAIDIVGNSEPAKSSWEARLARDTQDPVVGTISINPDPAELGDDITISVTPSDVSGIDEVSIEITLGITLIGNFQMTKSGSDYEYTYTPADVGTATFDILVLDNNGNSNSDINTVEIMDTTSPTVNVFTTTPSNPQIDTSVIISVNVTDIAGISEVYINITDPDGGFVLNETMTLNTANGTYDHQTDYTILGDYEIEIWVIDENDQATQYQDTVTISDSEPPVADAGVDQQITVGTQVTLEGTASTDNHGIANYTWEFNDNGLQRLYGETPQYTFNSPGAYQITLRVRDFGGNLNEAKTWVNVSAVTNTGTVIGTAVDEDDNPVAGVTVYVEAYPSIQNETDSLGRFVLEGVPIGEQKIIFIKDGFERDSEDVFVESDQTAVTGDETLVRISEAEEETPLGLFAAIIAAIVIIVLLLLFFLLTKKKPVAVPEETVIDEVFLMYNDGRLIKHFTRRLKPDMDEDILSSMLVAVQDFVKDSFRDQEGMLDEMNFGRFQVLLGRGEHIILATIVLGDDPEHLKAQVTQCVKDIEEKYADALEDWDGDMQSLQGAAKYVMDLIDGNYAKEP